MAAITWRNVNAPNYGAANALLQSGNKAMSEGINSFGDILTAEGDRRKGINTDKAKAFAASMQGLDGFGDRRAEYMAGLGNNIDRSAVSDAFNLRKEGLQGDQTFQDTRDLNALQRDKAEYENGDIFRNLQREETQAGINRDNSAIATNNQQLLQSKYDLGVTKDAAEATNFLNGAMADGYIADNKRINEDAFMQDMLNMGYDTKQIKSVVSEYNDAQGITSQRTQGTKQLNDDLKSARTRLENIDKALIDDEGKPASFNSYSAETAAKSLQGLDTGNFFSLDSGRIEEAANMLASFSGSVDPKVLEKLAKGMQSMPSLNERQLESIRLSLVDQQTSNFTAPSKRSTKLKKERKIVEELLKKLNNGGV